MNTTIAAISIPNCRYGGVTARLRIVANRQFVTSDNKFIAAGSILRKSWYREINCTIANNILTVPSFLIDSTVDSDDPRATYSAVLFDSRGTRQGFFLPDISEFRIPNALGANISWQEVKIFNSVVPRPLTYGYPNINQVLELIKANSTVGGIAQLNGYTAPDITDLKTLSGTPNLTEIHNVLATLLKALGATTGIVTPPSGDVTAPSVPAMSAATGITQSSITWNWAAAYDLVGVTNYDLQIATDSAFTLNLQTIPLGNVLTYTNPNRAASTPYYAKVQAKDAAGLVSGYSTALKVVTSPPPPPPAPVASFNKTPVSGNAPLAVNFTDTSTGAPTAWAWTFGDGTTSNVQNPSHTFAAAGTYAVTLAASNLGGSNTTSPQTITVSTAPPAPVANTAPTASSVSIAGTATVGNLLTGSYTYADAQADPEAGTTFQWFRSDNTSGLNKTAISGATAQTYTAQAADAGKFLQFAVTPRSTVAPTTGSETYSAYTAAVASQPPAPTAPSVPVMSAATNVTSSSITWNWAAATGNVTAYDIQIATDSAFTVGLRSFSLGNVLTYNDISLAASTQYYARVQARNDALLSGYSTTPASAMTPAAGGGGGTSSGSGSPPVSSGSDMTDSSGRELIF